MIHLQVFMPCRYLIGTFYLFLDLLGVAALSMDINWAQSI